MNFIINRFRVFLFQRIYEDLRDLHKGPIELEHLPLVFQFLLILSTHVAITISHLAIVLEFDQSYRRVPRPKQLHHVRLERLIVYFFRALIFDKLELQRTEHRSNL